MSEPPNIMQAPEGPSLTQIASRVLNWPLLLHPTKAEIILQVLQGGLPMDGAWIGAYSGMVSYEGITAQLRDAAADPEVYAVLLDIDSPGGEATGMFSVSEQIRLLSANKPVTAFVNDMAASAAYGIASAANEIVISPTSIVGSIGVVLTHLDRSGELDQKGVRATLIYAGKHKVDGNPFGPLSEAVQADLQTEVLKFYDQFVGLVARGRSGLTEQAIRATEARTFIGQDTIDRGLADRVASLDEVLASLSTMAPGAAKTRKGYAMSNPTQAAPQAETAGITEAAMSAAVDTARAEGHAAGKAEAKGRIKIILTCDEAKGRDAQAMVLALDTQMSAEDVSKVLAASPKASAVAFDRGSCSARTSSAATPPAAVWMLPRKSRADGPLP